MSSASPHARLERLLAHMQPQRSQQQMHAQVVHGQEGAPDDLMDLKAARARSAKGADYSKFASFPRGSLKGKTLFISGASRGIGLAIALRAAQDGANIVVAAKSAEPQPNLPGTIYTAAEAIEKAGGKALPLQVDIRHEDSVQRAVEMAVKRFGGIDILVNNASAISLTPTDQTSMKKYDLMHSINARGTFLLTKLCLPYLRQSQNPHVLTLGPPIQMVHTPAWFGPHAAYSVAKYNMSLYTLAHAAEFKEDGIACNCLWPLTTIATAAVQNLLGGDAMMSRSRKPEIMANAAHAILTAPAKQCTGSFFVDEHVLRAAGVKDLAQYACTPGTSEDDFAPDFFV